MTRETSPAGSARTVFVRGGFAAQNERCAEIYLLMRSLLGRAGHEDIVRKIQDIDTFDDLLRTAPQMAPVLFDMAWGLRAEGVFRQYFLDETGEPARSEEEPLASCGVSFAEMRRRCLCKAAQLHFEHVQRKWARSQARIERKKFLEEAAGRKETILGDIISKFRGLAGEHPDFSTDAYLRKHPGYGLYRSLRPFLREEWQFSLVPLYARMSKPQFHAVGELILDFRTEADLEALIRLSEDDLALVRNHVRLFTKLSTGVDPGRKNADMAELKRFAAEEKRNCSQLLPRRFGAVQTLLSLGNRGESFFLRAVPVFGEGVWDLLLEPQQVENILSCPQTVFDVLKASVRSAPPVVTASLGQIRDATLRRDLLSLLTSMFSGDELEKHLADPLRRSIWIALPGKFNNLYAYQPDAPKESLTLRNYENLGIVAAGIAESLRQGMP